MQNSLLVMVSQGCSLINQHFKDSGELFFDSNNQGMSFINLDVNLHYRYLTDAITLIKYSATS